MGTLIEFSQHELTAYRADPPGEVRGAVVVVQEIWGLTDHIIDVTDRFRGVGLHRHRPRPARTHRPDPGGRP